MKTKLTKSEIDKILGIDTKDLIEVWDEFVAFRARTAKTKIVSKESEVRIFKKLAKMSSSIPKLKAIVEQTIDNGWMGFYEPRDFSLPVEEIDFNSITKAEMDLQPEHIHSFLKRTNISKYIQLYPEKF